MWTRSTDRQVVGAPQCRHLVEAKTWRTAGEQCALELDWCDILQVPAEWRRLSVTQKSEEANQKQGSSAAKLIDTSASVGRNACIPISGQSNNFCTQATSLTNLPSTNSPKSNSFLSGLLGLAIIQTPKGASISLYSTQASVIVAEDCLDRLSDTLIVSTSEHELSH